MHPGTVSDTQLYVIKIPEFLTLEGASGSLTTYFNIFWVMGGVRTMTSFQN